MRISNSCVCGGCCGDGVQDGMLGATALIKTQWETVCKCSQSTVSVFDYSFCCSRCFFFI